MSAGLLPGAPHPQVGGRATERALCVLAPNPSPMTLDGTNTWILAEPDSEIAVVVDPGPLDHQLGQPLVQRDRVRVGVRARERDAQLLEQGGVERLAHAAAVALRRIEDDVRIDRLEALEQVRRRSGDLDLLDLVTGRFERRRDRVHGVCAVVFGFLLGLADVGEP